MLTGLLSPCRQLDRLGPGLMGRLTPRDPDATIVRLAGVMAVVEHGGAVHPDDPVEAIRPDGIPQPLQPV